MNGPLIAHDATGTLVMAAASEKVATCNVTEQQLACCAGFVDADDEDEVRDGGGDDDAAASIAASESFAFALSASAASFSRV